MARKKGLGRSGIPASSTSKKLPTLDDTDDHKDDLHAHGGTGLSAVGDAGEAGVAGPEEQGFVLDEVPLMEQGIVLGEITGNDEGEEEEVAHRDRREEKDPDYAPGMRTGRRRGGMNDDDEDWDAGEEGEVVVNPENRRHLKSTHAVQKKSTNTVVVTQKEIDEYFDELPHLPLNKNGGLTCKFCSEKLSRRFDVKRHCLNVHLERRNFTCQHCGDKFKRDAHLVAHIGSVHEGVSYKCKVCGQMFASESNRMRHHRVLHAGGSGSGKRARSAHSKKSSDGAGPSNMPMDEETGVGGAGGGDGEEGAEAGNDGPHDGAGMVEDQEADVASVGEGTDGKETAKTKRVKNVKHSNEEGKLEAGEGGFEIIKPTGVELAKPAKKPKGGKGAVEDGADGAIAEAAVEGEVVPLAAAEQESTHRDAAAAAEAVVGNEKSKKKKEKSSKVSNQDAPAEATVVVEQVTADHAEGEEAVPKEKRKRGRSVKEEAVLKAEKHEELVVEPGAGIGGDEEEPEKKRKRGRPSKAAKDGHEGGDAEPVHTEHEAAEAAVPPKEKEKKKRGRPSKANRRAEGAHDNGEEDDGGHEEILHEERVAADAASSSHPPNRESEPMEETSSVHKPEDELPFV